MDAEKLYPAHLRDTLRRVGLHKIAGAMLGCDEVTLKEAVAVIGAKAYFRRRETQKIAAGIDALEALTRTKEKTAASPSGEVLRALLRAGLPAAVGGAGLAVLPKVLSNDPQDKSSYIAPALLGGGLGLLGGAAGAGLRASSANPESAAGIAAAIRNAS
jgi:hypothetical protein